MGIITKISARAVEYEKERYHLEYTTETKNQEIRQYNRQRIEEDMQCIIDETLVFNTIQEKKLNELKMLITECDKLGIKSDGSMVVKGKP